MTVHKHGAHRDSWWAGFFFPILNLQDHLITYISVTGNAYESIPTRPFTVHLWQIEAVHVTLPGCAHLTWQMLPGEAQQQPPLTLPCPSDNAKGVDATQMTLETDDLAKLAHVLCTVWDCAQGWQKGVVWVSSQTKSGETVFQNLRFHRGSALTLRVSRANLWALVQTGF